MAPKPVAQPSRIKQFNTLKRLNASNGSIIVLLGKRGSGKTFALRNICSLMKDQFTTVVVWSRTEKLNRAFRDFVPSVFIYDEFVPEQFENIYSLQGEEVAMNGKLKSNSMLMIFDDIVPSGNSLFKNKSFRALFMEGRHSNITVVLASQYLISLPIDLRVNIDFALIWYESMPNVVKRLFENFGGIFQSLEQFKTAMTTCTTNHESLVLKLSRNTSSELSENVWWFKASAVPPFRLGAPDIWRFQQKYALEEQSAGKKRKHTQLYKTFTA